MDSHTIFAPDVLTVPEDWKDRTSWQFDSFVMHQHEEHCTTCSAIHRHSSVFRMFTRRNPASVDRRLVPASRVPNELSVVVYKLPIQRIPLCHLCLTDTRLSEIKILVSSDAQWNEAKRIALEQRQQKPSSTPTSRQPLKSLDDLL